MMAVLRGLRAVAAGLLVALAIGVNAPGIAAAFLLLSLAGWVWPYGSPWRVVDALREAEETSARARRDRGPATVAAPARSATQFRFDALGKVKEG